MKKFTINENRDFKRAYNKGKYVVSPLVVTYAIKNRLGFNRTGITTGKKTGNAVERNRCRRIIREAYRNLPKCTLNGFDIVFVSREKTKHAKTQNILKEMTMHFKKLGLIK